MKRPGTVITPNFCGIERLWEHRVLNVNGQLVSPSLFLVGSDFNDTAKTLTDRVTATVLAEAGAGASPTKGYAPWDRDGAVNFAAAKYLQDSGAALGDIATEDAVILAVLEYEDAGGADIPVAKNAATGWYLTATGNTIRATLIDADSNSSVISGAQVDGSIIAAEFFLDRSSNGRAFSNGAVSGSAADISGEQLTLANAASFALGATSAGTFQYAARVILLAMWKRASWLLDPSAGAGAAEALDLAKYHTELLFGARAPHHVAGTPRPSSW